jgi:hypothetical protein
MTRVLRGSNIQLITGFTIIQRSINFEDEIEKNENKIITEKFEEFEKLRKEQNEKDKKKISEHLEYKNPESLKFLNVFCQMERNFKELYWSTIKEVLYCWKDVASKTHFIPGSNLIQFFTESLKAIENSNLKNPSDIPFEDILGEITRSHYEQARDSTFIFSRSLIQNKMNLPTLEKLYSFNLQTFIKNHILQAIQIFVDQANSLYPDICKMFTKQFELFKPQIEEEIKQFSNEIYLRECIKTLTETKSTIETEITERMENEFKFLSDDMLLLYSYTKLGDNLQDYLLRRIKEIYGVICEKIFNTPNYKDMELKMKDIIKEAVYSIENKNKMKIYENKEKKLKEESEMRESIIKKEKELMKKELEEWQKKVDAIHEKERKENLEKDKVREEKIRNLETIHRQEQEKRKEIEKLLEEEKKKADELRERIKHPRTLADAREGGQLAKTVYLFTEDDKLHEFKVSKNEKLQLDGLRCWKETIIYKNSTTEILNKIKRDIECWIEMPGFYIDIPKNEQEYKSGYCSCSTFEHCYFEEKVWFEFKGPFYIIVDDGSKCKIFYYSVISSSVRMIIYLFVISWSS